jgi:4-hydroxybenzoyl-CoA reductase beta subunit
MMTTKLAPFQYKQPATIDQVFQLVGQLREEDRKFIFSGGGTDVISLLKQQLGEPHTVISLSGLHSLKQIRMLASGRIQIGALTSLATLINNSDVQEMVPALAEAAKKVASPQIRNQATTGGNILVTNRCIYFNQSEHNRESNTPCFKADGDICHLVKSATREKLPLCHARFVSDTVPVLLLLDAELVITGSTDERRIALKDLFLPDGIYCKDIQPDELLTFIEIDVARKKMIHYEKLSARDTIDFPSLGVAVGIETDDDGGGGETSILSVALTGVHTHPEFLEFRSRDYGSYPEMVKDACQRATRNALTFQQDLFPRGYRKKMIEVYIRQGIRRLTGDLWI